MEDEQSKSAPPRNPPPTSGPPPLVLPRGIATLIKILDHWTLSVLHNIALGFLTFDSLAAAYRARSDPWAVSFVVVAYSVLLLFYWCVRSFETAPPARKGRFMLTICALSVLLIAMFSYRVASMVPFGVAVAVWAVGGVSMACGFLAMLIFAWGFNKWN